MYGKVAPDYKHTSNFEEYAKKYVVEMTKRRINETVIRITHFILFQKENMKRKYRKIKDITQISGGRGEKTL